MSDDRVLLDTVISQRGVASSLDDDDYLVGLQGGLLKVFSPAVVAAGLSVAIGIGLVEDAIVNGVTTKAPSQNAVFDALALKAPLASPALTGVPTAPTAAGGTNTTQIATTEFVTTAISALSSVYQAQDADLTALAALGYTSGQYIIKKTAANTYSLVTMTSAAETLLALTDPGADRITFWDDSASAFGALALGTGLAISGTTLSLDSDLQTWAGLTPSAFFQTLVDDANAAAARSTLGLGTAATQNTGTSGANVPLLNAANTHSGVNTFSNTVLLSATTNRFRFEDTDAGTDEKCYQWITGANTLSLALLGDGFSGGSNILVVTRSGTAASEIELNATTFDLNGALDLSGNALISGAINLGHASDTTLSRSAAGVLAVEGKNVVTNGSNSSLATATIDQNIVPTFSDFEGAGVAAWNLNKTLLFSSKYGRGAGSADATDIHFNRSASYSGGTAFFVNSAFKVSTGSSGSGTAFEWNAVFEHNNSRAGDTQDCGLNVTYRKSGDHNAFAFNSVLEDTTENPTRGSVGEEADLYVVGDDDNGLRVIKHLFAIKHGDDAGGDDAIVSDAIRFSTVNARFKNVLNIDTNNFDYLIKSTYTSIDDTGIVDARTFVGDRGAGDADTDHGFAWAIDGTILARAYLEDDADLIFSVGVSRFTGAVHAAGASTISVAGAPLTLTNTTDSATNTGLIVQSDRGSPANFDNVSILLRLSDSAGNQDDFARIMAQATNVASGAESARFNFALASAGTLTTVAVLSPNSWSPNTNDTLTLGTSSLMWADLFLASGGVINWNNGDVLLTHSSNALAFTGATSGYSFDNTVTATLSTTSGSQAPLVARSTDAGALGPSILIHHDTASAANNDDIGRLIWRSDDNAGTAEDYGYINCIIDDTTAGSEDGHIGITVIGAGSRAISAAFYKDTITVGRSGVVYLYRSTVSDGVIKFNGGNTETDGAGISLTGSTNGLPSLGVLYSGSTNIANWNGSRLAMSTLFQLMVYTVAGLPSAAMAGAGATAFVSDANATTFASVVAGGGANNVPVYSDGANWRIG